LLSVRDFTRTRLDCQAVPSFSRSEERRDKALLFTINLQAVHIPVTHVG